MNLKSGSVDQLLKITKREVKGMRPDSLEPGLFYSL